MRPDSYVGRHVGPLGPFRVYTIGHGSWRWENDDGWFAQPYPSARAAYEGACGQQTDQLAQSTKTPWQDALWRALGFLSAAFLFGLLAWVLLLLHAVTRS